MDEESSLILLFPSPHLSHSHWSSMLITGEVVYFLKPGQNFGELMVKHTDGQTKEGLTIVCRGLDGAVDHVMLLCPG